MMNLHWKSRILLGPMRPFIAAKLRDGVRIAVDRLRFGLLHPTRITEALHTREGLFALPTREWFAQNSDSVLRFARSMRNGKVYRYGITSWGPADVDPSGVDVRAILELSRMHHWCAYALAAHIEPEQAHEWAAQFEHEVASFHAAHSSRSSPHWANPMDVGLRALSMLVAWDWLRRTGYENVDTDRIIAARAIDHALTVYLHRESRGGLSTSHYAGNLIGLLAVDAYVAGAGRLPHWSAFIRSELLRELQRQFLDDGMVQEASTGYHRHVLDLFVMAARLLSSADGKLPMEYSAILGKGLAALDALEGIGMPLIGDNDDGMAMKVTGFEPATHLLRDVAAQLGIRASEQRAWTSLVDFGLDIYQAPLSLTLRSGGVGQFGKGGHAHHDRNSISVSVGSKQVIVDPGSSQYTVSAEARNRQRSVQTHATMWPDDVDQGFINRDNEGLFWLPAFDVTSQVIERSAYTWQGVVRHSTGICHTRRVTRAENGMGISCTDRLVDGSNHAIKGCVRFPLGPDVLLDVQDDLARIQIGTTVLELSWQGAAHTLEDIEIAPAYGTSIRSQMLVLHGNTVTWALHMR